MSLQLRQGSILSQPFQSRSSPPPCDTAWCDVPCARERAEELKVSVSPLLRVGVGCRAWFLLRAHFPCRVRIPSNGSSPVNAVLCNGVNIGEAGRNHNLDREVESALFLVLDALLKSAASTSITPRCRGQLEPYRPLVNELFCAITKQRGMHVNREREKGRGRPFRRCTPCHSLYCRSERGPGSNWLSDICTFRSTYQRRQERHTELAESER